MPSTSEPLPGVLLNTGKGAFTFSKGNRGYCEVIFSEQENSRLDCWNQGNSNLLINYNFFYYGQMVKQGNNYEKQWQTFLGIKGTMQKFLGSRDFELKTY